MIRALKNWIGRVARDENSTPQVVSNGGPPMMSIYKIENGYLIHKFGAHGYREDARITFCPTPLDVAKQIVNSEALAKMGFNDVNPVTVGGGGGGGVNALNTSGYASGSLKI